MSIDWRRGIGAHALALWLVTTAASAQSDSATIAAINAVRVSAACAQGAADRSEATAGTNAAAGPALPLEADSQLDAAAAELARLSGTAGRPLSDILLAAGYRAIRSMFVQVSGVGSGAALARFVEQRYCAQIASRDWQEIGFYQRMSGTQMQTWLVLASRFTPPAPERAAEIGARVLALVNRARAQVRQCGGKAFAAAAPLKWNGTLAGASQAHAGDMAGHNYFSHEGRDGSTPALRATRAGYVWRAVGENIAAGQTSAEDAVQGWIDSPPHCANLMAPQFTEMGVAYAVNMQGKMGIYWAQVFGAPR